MNAVQHRQKALNIESSLAKCRPEDVEIRVEAAMLAATHWLNSMLHDMGVRGEDEDVLHTYMLTVNEFRRLSIASAQSMEMLAEIEDLRPLHVRGNAPGAHQAADRAGILLMHIRSMAAGDSIPARLL